MSKNLWITYAWKDNEDQDIDFIVQELDKTDINVKFDRRNLIPGQRLWTQIGGLLTDPNECDAWGIVLTSNSIQSQPCIEELSYALDRALSSNGEGFPLFALLHNVNASDLPPALKIRLCIPLHNNSNWTQQVVSSVKKEAPGFTPPEVSGWYFKEHITNDGFALEVRPRFDRISPFAVAVDYDQKANGNVTSCYHGPSGVVPTGFTAFRRIDSETNLTDGTHAWVWGADNEANSTTSYYLFYKTKPPRIWFGHQQQLQCVTFT